MSITIEEVTKTAEKTMSTVFREIHMLQILLYLAKNTKCSDIG